MKDMKIDVKFTLKPGEQSEEFLEFCLNTADNKPQMNGKLKKSLR